MYGDTRLPVRFWSKVDVDPISDCWLWNAGLVGPIRQQYAGFWFDGQMRRAHRVAYTALIGEVPSGLVLDHLCRNPKCVNPKHLEAVTNGENVLRGNAPAANALRQLSKTHCPNGHPYRGDNLKIATAGDRRCLTCQRERDRVRWAERSKEGLCISAK